MTAREELIALMKEDGVWDSQSADSRAQTESFTEEQARVALDWYRAMARELGRLAAEGGTLPAQQPSRPPATTWDERELNENDEIDVGGEG